MVRPADRAGHLLAIALLVAGCGASGGDGEAWSGSKTESQATGVSHSVRSSTTLIEAPATTAEVVPTTAWAPTTLPPLPIDPALAACGPLADAWFITTYTTESYVVHICESTASGGPAWYRGQNRSTGERVDLLADYGDVGMYANDGDVQYYVSREVLAVYEDEVLIFEEPILSVG